jgi:hypothetical protein
MLQMQLQYMQKMLFVKAKDQRSSCLYLHYLYLSRVLNLFPYMNLFSAYLITCFTGNLKKKGIWRARTGFTRIQVVL